MTDTDATQRPAPTHTDPEVRLDEPNTQLDALPTYQSLFRESETVQPRTLVSSGVLIFPSEPPANALYQLSRDLVAGTRISTSRIDQEIYTSSNNVPVTRTKDRLLYTFSHQIFDDSSIEITGKRRDVFPLLLMSRTSSIREKRWIISCANTSDSDSNTVLLECRHSAKWLHRSSNTCRWYDGHGVLIAVEEDALQNVDASRTSTNTPSLKIVECLDQKLTDALVTSWCARVWNQNLRATGQIRRISKGKNASFKQSSS